MTQSPDPYNAKEGLAELDRRGTEQRRDFAAQMSTAERTRSETRGRIMLLSAAIVGVVVPLLAKEPTLVKSAALKSAAMCWLVSLAAAAVGQALDRHTIALITQRFGEEVSAHTLSMVAFIDVAVAQPPVPEPDRVPKLRDARAFAARALDRLNRARMIRTRLQHFEDLIVYGAFIAGVIILIWGLR